MVSTGQKTTCLATRKDHMSGYDEIYENVYLCHGRPLLLGRRGGLPLQVLMYSIRKTWWVIIHLFNLQEKSLLMHKCMLLYAQGKFDEFHSTCKSLLFNMFKNLSDPEFIKGMCTQAFVKKTWMIQIWSKIYYISSGQKNVIQTGSDKKSLNDQDKESCMWMDAFRLGCYGIHANVPIISHISNKHYDLSNTAIKGILPQSIFTLRVCIFLN
jgi:hypothetical protein